MSEQEQKSKNYGLWLDKHIRATKPDPKTWSDYEHWVTSYGSRYDTEEALAAAYARRMKNSQNILVTEEEFVTEACTGVCGDVNLRESAARKTYRALAALVECGVMKPSEVYGYACYSWCLRSPEAIVAYQESRDKWHVNNCETKVTAEEAVLAVNREFGFEASRIKIIGTPYYDATDYMFIRFNCAGWAWLWKNGNIYSVYGE